jgi:hypothetical protein
MCCKNEFHHFQFKFSLLTINIKIFMNFEKNGAHLIRKNNIWKKKKRNFHPRIECFVTFEMSSIYTNFEHFASNGVYFKKEMSNPNYCVSFMIFQRYTIVILRNVHPLRLWMYSTIVINRCYFYFLMWHHV